MRLKHLLLVLYTAFASAQTPKTKVSAKERETQYRESGTKRATADFNTKIYILQTLGQQVDKDFDPFLVKTAKEKYGITVTEAPCVIIGDIKYYASAMREKVLAKFGNDIEDKIKAEALLTFKQSEQYKKNIQPKIDTGFVFTSAHSKAKFPGNETERYNFIKDNIQEIKNHSYWSENITFIVEKDGSLSNITFHREPKEEIKTEIIRIVQLMPKWTSAEFYGEKVRCKQHITIASKKEMEMMDEIRAKKYKPTN